MCMGYNKTMLLEQVIQEYLRLKEPIGSEMLKNTLSLKISSATIRNYFKLLMEEGILVQPHISGGRIPTHFAMKNYWRQRIDFKSQILVIHDDDETIMQICKQHEVFLLFKKKISQKLTEIQNVQDRYLILIFEKGEILLPYNSRLERFLSELIGLDIDEIKNIAYQVMAHGALKKMNHLQNEELRYFGLENIDFLIQSPHYHELFFEILEGRIFDKVQSSILFDPIFPEGYMGILQNVIQNRQEYKMLCIGTLMVDYQNFYEQIAA